MQQTLYFIEWKGGLAANVVFDRVEGGGETKKEHPISQILGGLEKIKKGVVHAEF